jgi:hypothetical protein
MEDTMMKNKLVFTGIVGLLLVAMSALSGCPSSNDPSGPSDSAVTINAVPGVTPPATGGTAAVAITETAQFTGAVTWAPQPAGGTFAASTAYTATIALTAKPGHTFQGVTADFFTVSGATTTTNAANSGAVSAVFPATGAAAPNFVVAVNEATANDAPTLGLVGTTATSSASTVATAEITGGKIKITSVSAGSATITVSDAAKHNATIQVTVAASGSITIGASDITKYVSPNPLLGAWREGPLSNITKLLVFATDTMAYYAPRIKKQQKNFDFTNDTVFLEVPGGEKADGYKIKVDGTNNLVMTASYFKDADGKSINFTFTRIEGSDKTDVYGIWYSGGLKSDDPLNTLLLIRTDNTVYAAFGMTVINGNFVAGTSEWSRVGYELIGPTPGKGTVRWVGGAPSVDYTIEEGELAILGDTYEKQGSLF